MSRIKDDHTNFASTPTSKKLRFRGEINLQNRIDEIFDDVSERRKLKTASSCDENADEVEPKRKGTPSFMDFVKVEMTRGYILEHDEERYSARRQKIYSFMKIPREVEKFMGYGVIQCADSFLYIHTFLPIRFFLAIWAVISRPIANCLGLRRRTQKLLTPAEICDLLKGVIWIACTFLMLSVDTNRIYHIIKSQSIIKLYIFYNMLEVGDRLLSAFGQDTIDALFWTATEPKNKKREHFGLIPHIIFALIYVVLHSFLIMFQATTLNVAVNSNNKGLLTIMISNNFVELKGSVFKKFDKNNLFQLTCSDVRERFHLSVLLFIVVIQTMKEFNWSATQFYVMLPDCIYVLITEILIDWVKHAFITRFNELPVDVYREYTISLAYDMTQTRQKHAFSDHSDLVARRMGFIPFPLGVVLIKAIHSAVSFDNCAAIVLFFIAYLTLMGCRILNTICALGKACELMKQHQEEKNNSTPASSVTNVCPIPTVQSPTRPKAAPTPIPETTNATGLPSVLHRSYINDAASIGATSTPNKSTAVEESDSLLDAKNSLELGATALFSNSDVDLDDVCLNEKVLEASTTSGGDEVFEEGKELTRSVPDLQQESSGVGSNVSSERPAKKKIVRKHKRSESEPSMQSIMGEKEAPA
ncbi:protein TAPT1 homolog [Eupeodes corollae]|uniref:protein TAPT1 homolog n=1 Tax=Eupeodes corollae TaxID=290404 RepID=UPI00249128DB|nr:protein TAPT1 homolog [Eupeodes corollae]